jgi:hypothetical protein
MSDISDIARAIGHQQGEYAYYRACYSLFKQLQDLVADMKEDLKTLHENRQSNSSEGLLEVSQLADHFHSSVQSISAQENNARSALAGLCSTNSPCIDSSRVENGERERKDPVIQGIGGNRL